MPESPLELLKLTFPHEPTPNQEEMFSLLQDFILDKKTSRSCLVLKGYAGTGKTTIISSLVKILPRFGYKYVLLAPTGRAAKVMSMYSSRKAFTIHKMIYKPKAKHGSGLLSFGLTKNYHSNTVFIVDEASMISHYKEFGGRGLLEDLVSYIFEGSGNRLLFIGDDAQLPPVGQEYSYALDPAYLAESYDLKVRYGLLTEVVRQKQESGILYNATALRQLLGRKDPQIFIQTNRFSDIFKMTGERLEDGLRYAHDKYGLEKTIVLTRSNKTANNYNQYIRRTIFWHENEIEAGDMFMVVKNNYHWVPEDSSIGFIANGDFAEVTKIMREEEMHGFRFVTMELRFLDYPNEEKIEAKVLLDSIYADGPALPYEEYKKLYESVSIDYDHIESKVERQNAIMSDPYLNALQLKFAYAVTCHKSQGGQWDAVFIDQGYLGENPVDDGFIRWLYTAVTRAVKELYLVNFDPKFYGIQRTEHS